MLLALLFSCLAKPAGLSELTPEHDALVLAWAQALDAGDLAQLAPHLHPVSAQLLSGGFDRPQALAHLLPPNAGGSGSGCRAPPGRSDGDPGCR